VNINEISTIIDFKSIVLPNWIKELYSEPDIQPTKEEIESICLDSYFRGIYDITEAKKGKNEKNKD